MMAFEVLNFIGPGDCEIDLQGLIKDFLMEEFRLFHRQGSGAGLADSP